LFLVIDTMDSAALGDFAAQHGLGQFAFQDLSYLAFQFAGAEFRLISFFGEIIDQTGIETKINVLRVGELSDPLQLQLDDSLGLCPVERMKDDDLIDTVEKFRAEMLTQG